MNYEGTVAVVSHDRSFIRRVGTKILEINHGQVTVYPGTYDEYVWSLEKGALALRSDPRFNQITESKAIELEEKAPQINYKEAKKILDRQLKQYEKALKEIDITMVELQKKITTLNTKVTMSPASKISQIVAELSESQKKLNELETEWLNIEEKKDDTIVALKKLIS
jgi:ATP-binding cassette subfamily F protein 3